MKLFGTDHTPRSHIPKFEPKLLKMDLFYVFSDSPPQSGSCLEVVEPHP